ncbi:MAG: hypothetical protein D6722_12040 [Bacteroidetes bacterium]|nr:MAG: hypothetical protein D6722_12040 [Bacteroidota bacterium]
MTLCLLSLPLQAQLSLERTVLASSSRTSLIGSLEVDWTLGESLVARRESGSLLLTEGFHQGLIGPLSSIGPRFSTTDWKLFPQPAAQPLQLQYEAGSLATTYTSST